MTRHSEAFIAHLQRLQERDRGAMAALRHSLVYSPGEDPRTYAYVERFAGKASAPDDPRRLALYATAGLFARHPAHGSASFAMAFGQLAKQRNSASIGRRFVDLLEANGETVLRRLRHAHSLLQADALGLDYARLLDDLSQWLAVFPNERALSTIRQHWMRDFHRAALAQSEFNTDSASFVFHLSALAKNDRAALSVLRRSLAFGPGDFPRACLLVEPFVEPEWSIHDARRRARYLVAGVFALNPRVSDKQSLASALGHVARRRESGSIESRFIALLGADAENVADHLRQAVRLVAVDDAAFNPVWLLSDLSTWLNPRADPIWLDRLRQRWARDYYQAVRSGQDSHTSKTQTEGA